MIATPQEPLRALSKIIHEYHFPAQCLLPHTQYMVVIEGCYFINLVFPQALINFKLNVFKVSKGNKVQLQLYSITWMNLTKC